MDIPKNKTQQGQWENKTQQQILNEKYRFVGERYGLRGTEHFGPNDYIPQISSLFPFPAGDQQST